jgi:hypothetical protein
MALGDGIGSGAARFVLLMRMGSEMILGVWAAVDVDAVCWCCFLGEAAELELELELESGNRRAMMRDGSAMDMMRLMRRELEDRRPLRDQRRLLAPLVSSSSEHSSAMTGEVIMGGQLIRGSLLEKCISAVFFSGVP